MEEILACFSAKDTTGSTPFALAQYSQAVVLDVYRLVDIDQILSSKAYIMKGGNTCVSGVEISDLISHGLVQPRVCKP